VPHNPGFTDLDWGGVLGALDLAQRWLQPGVHRRGLGVVFSGRWTSPSGAHNPGFASVCQSGRVRRVSRISVSSSISVGPVSSCSSCMANLAVYAL
jgi:hypothetical protein